MAILGSDRLAVVGFFFVDEYANATALDLPLLLCLEAGHAFLSLKAVVFFFLDGVHVSKGVCECRWEVGVCLLAIEFDFSSLPSGESYKVLHVALDEFLLGVFVVLFVVAEILFRMEGSRGSSKCMLKGLVEASS